MLDLSSTLCLNTHKAFFSLHTVHAMCHFIYLFIFVVVQVQLSPFSPTMTPRPTNPRLPPWNLLPLALSMCPLHVFFDGPSPIFPHYPLPPPLWLLSVCSLFQGLRLYFACWFVLLIRLCWFCFECFLCCDCEFNFI